MAWRRRLSAEQRDELKRGSNHFGEQAARAFLDGVMDVALGSSDRAIRDHEVLYREAPDDRETVTVLADRLRDRVEIRRHLVITAALAGRVPEAEEHARAGLADSERAIELHEGLADDPDPFVLWVPSVRLLMAEMHACVGRVDDARREGGLAIAGYRQHAGNLDDATPDLAHALMRYADLLGSHAADEALTARRQSVDLARPHLRVDGPLWPDRRRPWPAWASTPTLRHFSGSAHDLALSLGPPRADVAREALLALRDAIEGYAALPIRPTGLIDLQAARDRQLLTSSLRALGAWLDATGGAHVAQAYERALQPAVDGHGAGTDWHAEVVALRPRLVRHLDDELPAKA